MVSTGQELLRSALSGRWAGAMVALWSLVLLGCYHGIVLATYGGGWFHLGVAS